jgi:hypothetical protein
MFNDKVVPPSSTRADFRFPSTTKPLYSQPTECRGWVVNTSNTNTTRQSWILGPDVRNYYCIFNYYSQSDQEKCGHNSLKYATTASFHVLPFHHSKSSSISIQYSIRQEPGSSVWLQTGRSGFDPRQRQRTLPLTSASRPTLGTTQPPVQWVPGALSPGVKSGRGVMLTIYPLLMPRLRKSRSYTSCHPNAHLWSVTGPLHLLQHTRQRTRR